MDLQELHLKAQRSSCRRKVKAEQQPQPQCGVISHFKKSTSSFTCEHASAPQMIIICKAVQLAERSLH